MQITCMADTLDSLEMTVDKEEGNMQMTRNFYFETHSGNYEGWLRAKENFVTFREAWEAARANGFYPFRVKDEWVQ